MTVSFSF